MCKEEGGELIYILLQLSTAAIQVYSGRCSGGSKEPQAVDIKFSWDLPSSQSFRMMSQERPNGLYGEGPPVM